MGSLLGYSAFFPDQPAKSKSHYATLMGREFLFASACHFLSYFRLNAIPPMAELIREWFTYNEIKAHNNPGFAPVNTKFQDLQKSYPQAAFKLLTVESFLRMFMWLRDHPEISEKSALEGPEQCLPFFQLYLLFNDDVLKGFETARLSVKGIQDDKSFIRLALAMSFPQQDFLNVDYAQLLMTQFYKAAKLLEFLSGDERFQPILARFLDVMRCNSKEDYLRRIGPAVIASLFNTKPGWTMLNVPPGEGFDDACLFLESLSVQSNAEQSFQENDYLILRNNPLHELKKGNYRVIFDEFMIKKVYNGFFFRLSDLARNEKMLFTGDLLGILRDEFSEGTLLYNTLQEIYSTDRGTVTITGKRFKEEHLKVEPDFYLREGRRIVLFESKDFYIKGEYKISYDFTKIEPELYKDRLGKAVKQLATNMGRIMTNSLPLDKNYDPKEVTVFPVIIVHDALYTAPGLNYHVHYWLEDELIKIRTEIGVEKFNAVRIYPVTIVEIDTLILYQHHLKNKQLDLIDILEDFHRMVRYGWRGFKNRQEAERYANQSLLPFSEFIRDRAYRSNIILNTNHIDDLLLKFGLSKDGKAPNL